MTVQNINSYKMTRLKYIKQNISLFVVGTIWEGCELTSLPIPASGFRWGNKYAL